MYGDGAAELWEEGTGLAGMVDYLQNRKLFAGTVVALSGT